jgi:uncharacterized membrane protein (DUF373 family)
MSQTSEPAGPAARAGIARVYAIIEDIVYVGLGVLLAGIVLMLLVSTFGSFGRSALSWQIASATTGLLDRILLILLLVELLYTVQVSFREHALMPQPFLLVGLISVIRRVLVLTAVLGEQTEAAGKGVPPGPIVLELAVLAGLILALAVSLVLVGRSGERATATRT